MIDLKPQEILLLRVAMHNDGSVYLELLSSKYGISVKDAAIAYKSLSNAGLLKLENDIIKITKIGRNWVNAHQHLFVFKDEKTWRKVPDRFAGPTIAPFFPYAPRRSLLPKVRQKAGHRESDA